MPSKTPARVLCVDDDEDACEMLKFLMLSHGIDATCVRSAAEVWPIIKAESFDLYLLDGWLPKVDGFDLCRQLREFDSETPIVFYSGAAYGVDKEKGITAGANAYVVKPDLDGLIKTIVSLTAKAEFDEVAPRLVVKQFAPGENWPSAQSFSAGNGRN